MKPLPGPIGGGPVTSSYLIYTASGLLRSFRTLLHHQPGRNLRFLPDPSNHLHLRMYRKLLAGLLAVCLLAFLVEGRYLPTRSQEDRLVRLRQLLKDLLENDLDDARPDHPALAGYDPRMFKRDTYDRIPYMTH